MLVYKEPLILGKEIKKIIKNAIMSSCYLTGLLPFLNPTVPTSSKPNTHKCDTNLWVAEEFELSAEIFLYQASGGPQDGSVAFVTAKLSRNGSEDKPPQLEVISMSPCAGDPSDSDYHEHLPPPFQPIMMVTWTVERVVGHRITVQGNEYVVCTFFFL